MEMESVGASMSPECFICKESLTEGVVTLVKNKGLETLLACSVTLKNQENIHLLEGLSEISVHSACQKKYSNPKLIKTALQRGKNEIRPRSSRQLFNFKDNCFLCGEQITLEFIEAQKKISYEKRNHVFTVESLQVVSTLLKAVEKKNDEWTLKIKERISEDTDLPALRARYHRFCHRKLYRPIRKGLQRGERSHDKVDEAMKKVYDFIEENPEESHFPLAQLTKLLSENPPDIRTIKRHLVEKYGDEIFFASAANKTTIVCFNNTDYDELSDAWYIQQTHDPQEDRLRIVEKAADIIREDICCRDYNTKEYPPTSDFLQNMDSDIPNSLKVLMETLIYKNKKGNQDKWRRKVTAISHAIMSAVRPSSFISSLLHGIGIYLHHKFGSSHLIQLLSAIGFCASYSNILQLETSAILRPDQMQLEKGTFVQFAFDNADVNINTLDGLDTFHALGGIMMVTPSESIIPEQSFDRVNIFTASHLTQLRPPVRLQTYQPKTYQGLANITIKDVDRVSQIPEGIVPSSADTVWLFGKSIQKWSIPGWNGFMEEATNHMPFETSRIFYLPFINYPPSQYDTLLTALRMAKEKCDIYGMNTCFVTFDQPLYKKAKEIIENSDKSEFHNVVVRLGGFHLLMSFMGTIGMIMEGSGLKEVFSNIYAPNSIPKMMSGHSYARAVRAHTLTQLAVVMEVVKTINLTDEENNFLNEILCSTDHSTILTLLENEQFQAIQTKFTNALDTLERNGPTAKLWVQYVEMVTLMKQFIEAERTGNWDLHLMTIQKMLPFFHAAGHFFYAKCAQIYLQDMLSLEERMNPLEFELYTKKGYFTIRRTKKFWRGIWSDMTIEQVLMRAMKSYGGLTRGRGMTDSVLTRWTLGTVYLQNICADMENYCDITSSSSEQHVDRQPSRMTRDDQDTEKLRGFFSLHPPFPDNDSIISLSSGLVGSDAVNCHNSVNIGKEMMSKVVGENFENVKFSRKNTVKTFASAVNSVLIGERKVTVDPLTLFHRLCILKKTNEELKEFFTHELSPFPMALFTENGIRKGTKSSLYAAFTPLSPDEMQQAKDTDTCVVVDGGHLLHKVVWPRNASFGDIIARYIKYLQNHYGSNITVVFDGYPTEPSETNTKNLERLRRAKTTSSPNIIFDKNTIASVAQDIFLSNDNNKIRLIDMLKVHLERNGISTLQAEEDADWLIVSTAISMSCAFDVVKIVGDDIDLLVILCGLSRDDQDEIKIRNNIIFEKCGKGKTRDVTYSINSFSHQVHPPMALFLHAFSGCDTTSAIFAQGKIKFLTTLKKHRKLEETAAIFLKSDASPELVIQAGERFLVSLYGGNSESQSLDDLRFQLFIKAAAKSNMNLARLPPTTDSAKFHSLRTYYQIQKWLGVAKNPLDWGWTKNAQGMVPRPMSKPAAPITLLKMISCNCKKGCTNSCGCRKAGLKCSTVCSHCCGQSCENVPDLVCDDTELFVLDNTISDDAFDLFEQLDEAELAPKRCAENLYRQPGPSKISRKK